MVYYNTVIPLKKSIIKIKTKNTKLTSLIGLPFRHCCCCCCVCCWATGCGWYCCWPPLYGFSYTSSSSCFRETPLNASASSSVVTSILSSFFRFGRARKTIERQLILDNLRDKYMNTRIQLQLGALFSQILLGSSFFHARIFFQPKIFQKGKSLKKQLEINNFEFVAC